MYRFHYFIDYCRSLVDYDKCDSYPDWFNGKKMYKFPSIKYSKRMLSQASAVDMYLLIRAELHKKYEVVKNHLPAFNYAVPEHER